MKKVLYLLLLAVLFPTAWISAQELVHDEQFQVSYDSLDCWLPIVVFNGLEHGALYYWEGTNDDIGLCFRRLAIDGKPVGPQKKVVDVSDNVDKRGRYVPTYVRAGLWDGEAYVFLASSPVIYKYYLMRVSAKGELLKLRVFKPGGLMEIPYDIEHINDMFVIGDRLFYFCTLPDSYYGLPKPFILQCDRNLVGPISLERLETGGKKVEYLLGVTHDTDKFVLLIGDDFAIDDPEFARIVLLHVDFSGKVIKKPVTVPYLNGLPVAGISPSDSEALGDVSYFAGPVYVGDGFAAVASNINYLFLLDPALWTKLPYTNNAFKMDENGAIIGGPFNLGSPDWPYWFTGGILSGNHASFVGAATFFIFSDVTYSFLIGKKGGHIGNVELGKTKEKHYVFEDETTLAYTGFATTFVYTGNKPIGFSIIISLPVTDKDLAIYSNQYTMPEFSKPAFFYFQAGTAEPVENHRLVMWSIVQGKNVTLKGPDFEMTNLPPVWSYLVDTKGQKTRLVLSFTTEDGKTKKKRLVIEP